MADLHAGNGHCIKKYKKIIPVGKKSCGDLLYFGRRPEYEGVFMKRLVS